MGCSKCSGPTEGFKCDMCGEESETHVEDHSCGGAHCVAKCQGCGEAESKCTCEAAAESSSEESTAEKSSEEPKSEN